MTSFRNLQLRQKSLRIKLKSLHSRTLISSYSAELVRVENKLSNIVAQKSEKIYDIRRINC